MVEKACNNLRDNDVDLYGSTRHSTATALRKFYSSEEIKNSGTLHSSSQAFERYLQANIKNSILLYETASKIKRFVEKSSLVWEKTH